MTAALPAAWCKLEAGHYYTVLLYPDRPPVRFDVMYFNETRLWCCYRDDRQFDAGRTLREAKGYCQEPER